MAFNIPSTESSQLQVYEVTEINDTDSGALIAWV